MSYRDQRDQELRAYAAETYKDHVILEEDNRSWLLRRPPGMYAYSTEIVATRHGELYVGGDIDHVLFARNHDSAIQRVAWMGDRPLSGYVVEKAAIGTGRDLVHVFDGEAAEADIRECLAVIAEEESSHARNEAISALEEALDEGLFDSAEALAMYVHDRAPCSYDYFESCRWGSVVDTRVYFAQAAVARLHALLAARDV